VILVFDLPGVTFVGDRLALIGVTVPVTKKFVGDEAWQRFVNVHPT
jgi:hypothetical protein